MMRDDTTRNMRNAIIEECINAARDGFEIAMKNYVLIGPSGMAMQMINSIKALKDASAYVCEVQQGDDQ